MQYCSEEDARYIQAHAGRLCCHLDWYVGEDGDLRYQCQIGVYCENHPRVCGNPEDFFEHLESRHPGSRITQKDVYDHYFS